MIRLGLAALAVLWITAALAGPPTSVCGLSGTPEQGYCIIPNSDGSINVTTGAAGTTDVNLAKVGGATVDTGAGTGGGATQRTILDSSQVTTLGVAGTPSSAVMSVQGITSGTPVNIGTQQTGTGGTIRNQRTCDLHAVYDASDNGSVTLITGVSGRQIYICGYILATGGTATNLKLVEGSDANCASNITALTPAYQLVANDKVGAMSGIWSGLRTSTVAYYLCVNASAGNAHQAEVWYSTQ
jgi:hypothetical protein